MCCFLNFLFSIGVVMTMCVVHTARILEKANLQDWLEDRSLPLVIDEERLITNQNNCMTDPRKHKKATKH